MTGKTIRILQWHNTMLPADWSLPLSRPAPEGYTVRVSVWEDRPNNQGRYVYEEEYAVPFRPIDRWDSELMPPNSEVLQSAEEWYAACNPKVTGSQLPDGSWALDGGVQMSGIRDPRYEFVGVGVHAQVRLNNEVLSKRQFCVQADPLGPSSYTIWGAASNLANNPNIPEVNFAAGDVLELVLQTNRILALENLSATSYWEGEVVIPITEIVEHPSRRP